MAEDAPSQLPLPSPGSPAEQRKRSKSRSELQETSEETYEFRKTAAGQYEKKTAKSERHEVKASQEETFVSTGLPSQLISTGSWHEQVPERVKLEVSGVTADGCPDAPGLDADYILDLVDRRPERCRWEYTFRAKCRLFRCCLEVYPDSQGKLTLQAFFEGSVAGPVWTQTGLRDLSRKVMLAFDRQSAGNPIAGCHWPETVTLTPLATPAATKPFYISPEPTLREMAAMAASGSWSASSSSEDPCPKPKGGPGSWQSLMNTELWFRPHAGDAPFNWCVQESGSWLVLPTACSNANKNCDTCSWNTVINPPPTGEPRNLNDIYTKDCSFADFNLKLSYRCPNMRTTWTDCNSPTKGPRNWGNSGVKIFNLSAAGGGRNRNSRFLLAWQR